MQAYSDILKKEFPFKTELHAHTCPCSACATASPEDAVLQYKANGYDTLVLTNHLIFEGVKNMKVISEMLNAHISDFERAQKMGDELGVCVLMGYELRFPKSYNDYLFYGASPDFFKGLELDDVKTLEAFCRVREKNTLLIQAHPFRSMMSLAPTELIDGIEAFNVSPPSNSKVGLAANYAMGENLLCTCGTDFHHTNFASLAALCTRDKVLNIDALISALKANDVAWQIGRAMLVF